MRCFWRIRWKTCIAQFLPPSCLHSLPCGCYRNDEREPVFTRRALLPAVESNLCGRDPPQAAISSLHCHHRRRYKITSCSVVENDFLGWNQVMDECRKEDR